MSPLQHFYNSWKGNLLIAIHNHSNKKIKLVYGEAFCTIVFVKNLSESTKLCKKEDGRSDIFLKEFDEEHAEARKCRRLQELLPLFIILVIPTIGYYMFGNNAGFAISVAISVAISNYVTLKLK